MEPQDGIRVVHRFDEAFGVSSDQDQRRMLMWVIVLPNSTYALTSKSFRSHKKRKSTKLRAADCFDKGGGEECMSNGSHVEG